MRVYDGHLLNELMVWFLIERVGKGLGETPMICVISFKDGQTEVIRGAERVIDGNGRIEVVKEGITDIARYEKKEIVNISLVCQ